MQNSAFSVRKEHLNKFTSLFVFIPEAAHLLKMSSSNGNLVESKKLIDAEKCLLEISCIPPNTTLLIDVIEEIEINLYNLSDLDRSYYIKNIIRSFADAVKYFDFNTPTVLSPELPVGTIYVPLAEYSRNLLFSFSKGEFDFNEGSDAEKYLILTYTIINSFATSLDEKCLCFDLDFQHIQKEADIYLQRYRRWEELARRGHKQVILSHNSLSNELPIHKYLTEEGKKLVPYIEANYQGIKPSNGLTALILALNILELLKFDLTVKGHQTEFHKALVDLLGEKIGTPQAFNASIADYDRTKDEKKLSSIQNVIKSITQLIDKQDNT